MPHDLKRFSSWRNLYRGPFPLYSRKSGPGKTAKSTQSRRQLNKKLDKRRPAGELPTATP
jgi:hypothetical protein